MSTRIAGKIFIITKTQTNEEVEEGTETHRI